MRRVAAGLFLILAASSAAAVPTRINITKLSGGDIAIDGDVSDSGWQNALRIDQFVEYFKSDNSAPPARTIGYLTYDAQYVYVAFHAEDPQPTSIRAPFVDRDKVLGDQDFVAVLIDTQNDRRSAIAFRVNPRGIQTDSVVNDANNVEDFSPDFFYEAVARSTPGGWSAEMRIPLSSLRYPNTEPQTWGVILMRNYPRDFRYIMANTPIPKNSNCFVCHASSLTGLYDLPSGGHITIAPYSTAQRYEHRSDTSSLHSSMTTDPLRNDFGLDMKWNPSAKVTVDGTLNPDFSQIESDVPQLSVNSQFALEYPEKRTFFLEGTDLLSTPVRAVYTRTITSPAWGIRATGQSGSNAYTVLLAEDRGGGSMVLPGTFFSETALQDFRSRVLIGRLRRTFGSSFGGMLVSAREIEGGGYNRLAGPDILWKPTLSDRLLGQVLFSRTENPDRTDLSPQFQAQSFSGYGARFIYTRDKPKYEIWASYRDYSPGFRADNGFVPQVGIRVGYGEIARSIYPKKGLASLIRPYFGADYGIDHENAATNRHAIFPGFYFEGKWGSSGWVTWRGAETERVNDRLLNYSFLEWSMRAAPRRWLPEIKVGGAWGGKLDYAKAAVGRGAFVDVTATVRPTDHLELQANSKRDWLDGHDGARVFTAQVERLKTTYTFSSRSLVRLIGQYSDFEQGTRSGSLTTSALYGYKLNWQTLFFVGYGDERLLDDEERYAPMARSLFMKVSYAFQR